MANHEIHNSEDLAAAVNNQPQPIRRSTGHDHDSVVGVAKHLHSTDGTKGAAVAQELISLANPEHDQDSMFSNHPKNMRSHLPDAKETK